MTFLYIFSNLYHVGKSFYKLGKRDSYTAFMIMMYLFLKTNTYIYCTCKNVCLNITLVEFEWNVTTQLSAISS